MKCRRICRELLWLARFGEFGPSSAPHLDHLASCRSCRDEVGFDRALVQQLRSALAARIGAANPSSRAWEGILERMRQPERRAASRFREWSLALVGRLRVATAVAGTGLALVLALNLEVVPVAPPSPSDAVLEALAAEAASVPGPGDDFERNPTRRMPSFDESPGAPLPVGTTPERKPDAEGVFVRGPVNPGTLRASTDVTDGAGSSDPGVDLTGPGSGSADARPIMSARLVLRDADVVVAAPAPTDSSGAPSSESGTTPLPSETDGPS
jgi:hypothetical protein